MVVPEGCNRNQVIDAILLKCDCFTLLYPDWEVMQDEIGNWSLQRAYMFNTLWKTLSLDYNPIENYDRTEKWTDTDTKKESRTGSSNTKSEYATVNEGDSTTNFSPGTTNTTTQSGKAFNSLSFVETGKTVQTDSGKDVTTNTTNSNVSGSDTTQGGSTDSFTADNKVEHDGRIRGNIGVTTSQQMIEQERQVALFNFYDAVAEDFKDRFCSLCYV